MRIFLKTKGAAYRFAVTICDRQIFRLYGKPTENRLKEEKFSFDIHNSLLTSFSSGEKFMDVRYFLSAYDMDYHSI